MPSCNPYFFRRRDAMRFMRGFSGNNHLKKSEANNLAPGVI
jgi:hypothetical protein